MKIILTFISFFIFTNAFAKSNWQFVTSNDEQRMYFVDLSSMQRSGDSVTFWSRENFAERDEYGNLSLKVQVTFNCRTREQIARFYMAYDDLNNNGKLTYSFDAPNQKWRPIAPETVNWQILKVVCKR